jgi:hypothetical protein
LTSLVAHARRVEAGRGGHEQPPPALNLVGVEDRRELARHPAGAAVGLVSNRKIKKRSAALLSRRDLRR